MIVPPAALTMLAAFEGIAPPENDTRYVWLAVRALALSDVSGASMSVPQATSEVDRQSDRANPNHDRCVGMGPPMCWGPRTYLTRGLDALWQVVAASPRGCDELT